MMTLLLLLSLLAPLTFADSLSIHYARNDAPALAALMVRTTDAEQVLLCRYRLFPLTMDERYLDDLPADASMTTARGLALLSAMWAYRTSTGPVWKVPSYGRRATGLLERARRIDPRDPYVLLVDGQSLLYRPRIFGGDPRAALDRFDALRRVVQSRPGSGISLMEADVWRWFALRQVDAEHADHLRARLLRHHPPPLFRQFLLDPPG
jgi:hypothetical protein